MKKFLFFMISIFLFFFSIANGKEENNDTTTIINNTIINQSEKNISKKIEITKKQKKSYDNNSSVAYSEKIFLVNKPSKTKSESKVDYLNDITIKNSINFSANFQSSYKIKSGDTLGKIARKFGVAQGEIKRLNMGVDFDSLTIGKELIMPISQEKIDEVETKELISADKNKIEAEQKIIFIPKGRKMRVIASAYTSHANQTDGNPFVGAWGERFSPGMQIVAISNDLIKKYGITNGTKIKISGLDGYYTIRDKMNKRYTKHIDIYMGLDRAKALRWGRRSVVIYW